MLIKYAGPAVGRVASGAASKAGSFLYSDWASRTKAKRVRASVTNKKIIENELTNNVPDISPEVAAHLATYLSSADFADICLRLTLELAPLGDQGKKQAAEVSSIKAELLASIRISIPLADHSTTEVISRALFRSLVEATITASSMYLTLEKTNPDIKALGVSIAANAANAALRNTDLLATLGSLTDIWKFETRLREQIRVAHASMKLPHAGTTRKVPYRKLFVQPNFIMKPGQQGQQGQPQPENVAFDDLLSSPRVVILGNPGGGKSTLALKHTYDLARNSLQGVNSVVPFLVVLRDYAEQFKQEKRTMVSYIESLCREPYNVEPPHGAIEYLLLNGRAFVIFDGLDELTDVSVRKRLVESLEAFANLYPTVPILVTSREVGYEQAALDPAVFQVFNLASLGQGQVQEYVDKWFALDESIDPGLRKSLAQGFMLDSTYVSDLRSNPLMLSLMCGIYSSEHYIPANRPEVYRKCAELLFERWDKQRGIFTPLPFDAHVRLALNALALWMYSNPDRQNGISRDELTRFMTRYLLEKRFTDEAEAENAAIRFIDFCTGRAWVLTDIGSNPQQELYGFTHRTFLEFFAATQLARLNPSAEALLGALREKLAVQEWDVVAQLGLQILGNNVEDGSDDFLSLLMNYAETEEDRLRQRSLSSFAARALAFVVPRPDVVRRIAGATINGLQQKAVDAAHGEEEYRSEGGPYPFFDLFQCSDENLPAIASAIHDDVARRLAADPYDEISLQLSLFVGEYRDDGAVTVFNHDASKNEFWHSRQHANLAEFRSCFEAQALRTPWIDVMRATLGETPIADVIARHGVRSLFIYRTATLSLPAPFAYRFWTKSNLLTWRDAKLDACAAELPTIFTTINRPWLDLADDQVFASVNAVSGDVQIPGPTLLNVATIPGILLILPILEGIPDRYFRKNTFGPRVGRTGSDLPLLQSLYLARMGGKSDRVSVMKAILALKADSAVLDIVNEWLNGKISLSWVSSPSVFSALKDKYFGHETM